MAVESAVALAAPERLRKKAGEDHGVQA